MLGTRSLSAADFQAVVRINVQGLPGVAALEESELARLMTMPNHHLVVESANSLIVGYALAFDRGAPYDGEEFQAFKQKLAEPFIYIDQVATLREVRRTGIGATIYEAIENKAKLSDALLLCCEVNINPLNPESMAFHQNRGFRQLESMATEDGRVVALLIKEVH